MNPIAEHFNVSPGMRGLAESAAMAATPEPLTENDALMPEQPYKYSDANTKFSFEQMLAGEIGRRFDEDFINKSRLDKETSMMKPLSENVKNVSLDQRFDMDGDGDVDANDLRLVGVSVFTWANANRGKAITMVIGLVVSLVAAALTGDLANVLTVATEAIPTEVIDTIVQ